MIASYNLFWLFQIALSLAYLKLNKNLTKILKYSNGD